MAEGVRSVQRALIVSDLHIRSSDRDNARRFLAFLRERVAVDPGCTLVVAGDLFDFWYAFEGLVPEPLAEVVAELQALPDVIWIEGNHDLRLPRGLGPDTSIDLRRESVELRWAGSRVRVEHGDLVRRRGRLTRGFFYSPLAELGARLLGPERIFGLGNRVAARRDPTGGGYEGQSAEWLKRARRCAARRLDQGFDLSVMGHGHWLGEWPDQGLICLGDWLRFFSYLELAADGTRELRCYEPEASEDPLPPIPR